MFLAQATKKKTLFVFLGKMKRKPTVSNIFLIDILQESLLKSLIGIIEEYRNPRLLIETPHPSAFLYCESIANITAASTRLEHIDDTDIVGVCAPNSTLQTFKYSELSTLEQQTCHDPLNRAFFFALSPLHSRIVYVGSKTYDYGILTHVHVQYMLDGKRQTTMPNLTDITNPIYHFHVCYAVTETHLIGCVRDKAKQQLEIKSFNHSMNAWDPAETTHGQMNDQKLLGLCGNVDWLVITQSDGLLIYNRKKKNFQIMSYGHDLCCASLDMPVVWDNMVYLFRCSRNNINVSKYDLLTLTCVEHHPCNVEHYYLQKTIKNIIVY